MEQVYTVKVPLAKSHYQQLSANANDCNMSVQAFIQRLLQHNANSEMPLPDPLARQVAQAAVSVMTLSREMGEARRAYESVDGDDDMLGRILEDVGRQASDVLTGMSDVQKRIFA